MNTHQKKVLELMKLLKFLIHSIFITLILTQVCIAQKSIVVSSTTSTEQSGLFNYLLPIYEKISGIQVKVIAVGTGQALYIGRRGDADVVFVHDRVAEEKFLNDGFSQKRYEVMYNDFILIGPENDPAKIVATNSIQKALELIALSKSTFVSRGDKSGTHAAELRYWKDANLEPNAQKDTWYKESGSGMGASLNTASAMNAYILTDRGTWISFKNRGKLKILVQGDPKLFNQYGVMLVNPDKYSHIKKEEGQSFINWLISPNGQKTIAGYQINGEQLFFPNAKP